MVSCKRPLALDVRGGTSGWRTVGRRIAVSAVRASASTSCQAQQHKNHGPLHACPPSTRKASTASLANLRAPCL